MSGLWFHDRDSATAPIAGEDRALLANVFGAASDAPTASDAQRAVAFLKQLRARRQWLACRCCKDTEALISPRLLSDGSATLVRHGRHEHDPACPFHRTRTISIPTPRTDDESTVSIATPYEGAFELLQRPRGSRRRNTQNATPAVEADMPSPRRLHRLLATLLSTCAYDTVRASDLIDLKRGAAAHAGHRDVPRHYRQIGRARSWPVASGISLGDTWCTQLVGVDAMLARVPTLPWPPQSVRQGSFVGLVDAIGPDGLEWTRRDGTRISAPLTAIAADAPATTGPYWALAVAGAGRHGTMQLLCAHAIPAYSRRLLLPVADDRARSVARILLRQLRYWLAREDLDVTLHRPLFTPSIPATVDFHISLPAVKPIAVIVRREGVVVRREDLMRTEQLADVVFADPAGDPFDVARQLTAALMRAAGRERRTAPP